MRILITGGAGFIGSHLAEAFLSRGDEVLIVDDLSTGSMENIRQLKKVPKLHYWIESVMNKALLAELFDESDLVVHLAAAVGVRLIVQSPVRTIETNIEGTELVLEAARKKRRWCSLLRPRRSTARTRTFPSVQMAIWSWGRPIRGGGAMPPRKRWMNSWL